MKVMRAAEGQHEKQLQYVDKQVLKRAGKREGKCW